MRKVIVVGEDVCPICQENTSSQPLTFCKKKCGNNFHIKCLKIWFEHKQSEGDKFTCPMCRADMGHMSLQNLEKEERAAENRFIVHESTKCESKNIMPNRLKAIR